MISFVQKGNFEKTFRFLKKAENISRMDVLNAYGMKGVAALKAATPKDSGATAEGWYYTISKTKTGYKITWRNSNVNDGVPIAIILQYGHGTGTGGYVQGQDYINPALRDIFEEFSTNLREELNQS